MKPTACREVVGFLRADFGMSERRACRVLGFCRASARYEPRRDAPIELVGKLREPAAQRPRWGYRRFHILLRREGIAVNHKRVYRLYRAEGLALRCKLRKRLASALRTVLPPPGAPNERWSMDFVSDQLVGGTRLRAFNVVDDFTRECLAIEVDTSIPGLRATRVVERIAAERPLPKYLICDNGPEFTGAAFDSWAHRRGVRVHFIRPGKPVENAYRLFDARFIRPKSKRQAEAAFRPLLCPSGTLRSTRPAVALALRNTPGRSYT